MLFLFSLIVAVALAVYGVGLFNALHVRHVACDGAFSRIAVQMQRRYDLLASLARIVKSRHHGADAVDIDLIRAVHDDATAALAAALGDRSDAEVLSRLVAADEAVGVALNGLSSLIDKRPSLRADDELVQLREELISTDNKIAFARRAYNEAVVDYQGRRGRFPGAWLAPLASLRPLAPFVTSPLSEASARGAGEARSGAVAGATAAPEPTPVAGKPG